jgi:hypothetical protein
MYGLGRTYRRVENDDAAVTFLRTPCLEIRSRKTENTTARIRRADHVTPSIRKSSVSSPTSGGRSFGIVRSRTQVLEFSFSFLLA